MKINIGLSAAGFKKNERVVVKVAKNEWHVGTIIKSGVKLEIDFDDGHEATVSATDFKHVKSISPATRTTKTILTDAAAKALIAADASLSMPPTERVQISVLNQKEELFNYLEGDPVSDEWADSVCRKLSKQQPGKLYRLCIVPASKKLGDSFSEPKKLISASDKIINAIYAGCAYHSGYHPNLPPLTTKGKQLAAIQIESPVTLMSFDDLRSALKGKAHALKRLDMEREYMVRGPIRGKIVELVPWSYITDDDYQLLKKKL